MKNSCSLYKIEHSSTDLQPCLQMSSISLCHGLVLKIHSVVELQIQATFAIKTKTIDGLSHEMKRPCSLYKNVHSSAYLQPCFQMSSNSLCHGLVLKIHSVAEKQI